jgi:hypothetical protein
VEAAEQALGLMDQAATDQVLSLKDKDEEDVREAAETALGGLLGQSSREQSKCGINWHFVHSH